MLRMIEDLIFCKSAVMSKIESPMSACGSGSGQKMANGECEHGSFITILYDGPTVQIFRSSEMPSLS